MRTFPRQEDLANKAKSSAVHKNFGNTTTQPFSMWFDSFEHLLHGNNGEVLCRRAASFTASCSGHLSTEEIAHIRKPSPPIPEKTAVLIQSHPHATTKLLSDHQ